MEFRVLGPLEVSNQGQLLAVGAPRIRAVCGILLVRPGNLVGIEQFVDELWPDQPPPEARALVRGYISRLRRALRGGPGEPNEADRMVTHKPGYLLRVHEQELDLPRFDRLVAHARAARQAGQPHRSVTLFRRAHGLWRGDPFADVPHTASIAATVTWLTERRLATVEEQFDAVLAAGDDADVITELTEFGTAHPLRERAAAQLMLALYRSGRQAEALEHYQRVRRGLADDVGVDPGTELQQLHLRILNADPALGIPAGVAAHAAPIAVSLKPRQLPLDVPTFVGRGRELEALRTLLEADDAARPGPVVVIHGAPGVGKSALAVRAANLSATHFPGGQLYVNLCGATSGVEPQSPAETLHRLLRTLGVATADMPGGIEESAGLCRTMVADRRLLILLDNAATAAQLRPVLPGSRGVAVLITSRTRLAALEGATHLHLHPLSPGASRTMLEVVIADTRTATEPDATRRLAELCDHLPLGLHVAASRLKARPTWTIHDLVNRLADERHRLRELAAGDVALRSSLTVSHAALRHGDDPIDQAAAHALCLLGLLPVTGIDLSLAATLFNTTPPDADRIIERLLDAHLVEETRPGQYHMHDLIRLFAHELAEGNVLSDEHSAATLRVLSYYLATTLRANSLVYPHRVHYPVPDVDTPPKSLADQDHALRWLEEERANLVAVIRQALHGPAEHARLGIDLTHALYWFLSYGGDPHDAIALNEDVIRVAPRWADRRSEAFAHGSLAAALSMTGQSDTACDHHNTELSICRELGDRFGEQRALGNLGRTHLIRRSPDQAIAVLRQQLAMAQDIGASIGEAFALVLLGKAHHQLGDATEAVRLIKRGLAWYVKVGDTFQQCGVLKELGRIYLELGQLHQAISVLERSLDYARKTGCRQGEAWALVVLARVWQHSNDTDKALRCAQQAIAISDNLPGTRVRHEALAEHEKLSATNARR